MDRTELCRKIGASIRKYRLQSDMSQENLSLSAGLHPAYIGRLERGEKCPTVDTLYRISEALEISIFELLREDDEHTTDAEISRIIGESLTRIPEKKQLEVAKIINAVAELLE